MIFDGGTFATDGFSQTNALGALTLESDSVIDMGLLGSSILKFADSHSMPWSGTLTVSNWDGFFDGGGADGLFFGSSDSALTLEQLSTICFANPNGLMGDYRARILATGEVVPVPEPAMVALLASGGLLLGGFVVCRRRRKGRSTVRG